ncbi:DUF3368 domain-containing protein [Natrinema altunense]|uniref:DUF3368 domain-containing protein n=1 Tax=Natrinema altunense TaxID=222984 RepID=A0A482XY47_9EURY|nr:DUF3368 domain-containing protein [Natrinema altunense]RZH68102.1 DUF3368 domain-containing protein [Natrinema altunense]
MTGDDRTLLVNASTFITLAETGSCPLLYRTRGRTALPAAVQREITDDPAASELERAVRSADIHVLDSIADDDARLEAYERATEHLEQSIRTSPGNPAWTGDVALLGEALERSDAVVVTDDKPLRDTCKALSIPVSGSIGILVRAVERGDITADAATDVLLAMDETGARLSARLLRRAERLIEDAASDR